MTSSQGPLKIFSGRAHPALAQEICEYLDLELGRLHAQNFSGLGPVRRLSTMAMPTPSRLAIARARATPPASGDTIVRSGMPRSLIASSSTGAANRWSAGMSKKP